jgi:threonine synthase
MPFRCHSCGRVLTEIRAVCEECGGFVRYIEADEKQLHRSIEGDPTIALPQFSTDISMGEGRTPLVALDHLDVAPTVYGKLESLNPTCSFKDRGSALAVSAVSDSDTSWKGLVVASTGNTAPSVAAYAARAGTPCAVLVPDGTSVSKLSQVAAHHVDIYTVNGTFSDCFRFAQRVSNERILNATAVYSANPFVASANRTVAFEIVARLGCAPDWVTIPVGAGPLLGGTHLGFAELHAADIIPAPPKMLCVQAQGCHPIVRAIEGDEPVRPWTNPIRTNVGAIADPLDGYAVDGEETRQAVADSDGDAVALDDEQIHEWTDRLAATEGIYAEPASAASVAAVATDAIDAEDTVVALVTGHGLKEPNEREPDSTPVGDDPDRLRTMLLG